MRMFALILIHPSADDHTDGELTIPPRLESQVVNNARLPQPPNAAALLTEAFNAVTDLLAEMVLLDYSASSPEVGRVGPLIPRDDTAATWRERE